MLVLALAACSKEEPASSTASGSGSSSGSGSGSGTAAVAASEDREVLLNTWKKAGLDVGAFAAAQTDVGKDCQTGKVAKLDVLVCAYKKPEDAKSSEEFGLSWVGSVTGASQAHGSLVIAIADKAKADPHGKTINQLLKLAPN